MASEIGRYEPWLSKHDRAMALAASAECGQHPVQHLPHTHRPSFAPTIFRTSTTPIAVTAFAHDNVHLRHPAPSASPVDARFRMSASHHSSTLGCSAPTMQHPSALPPPTNPDELADKVLRRAQISKMTRALQDRLVLANLKIQNGWEHMSLDAIEPQVEERLRRKRPASSNDTISDSASTTSSRLRSSSGPASSPLTAPIFSDDFNSPSKKRIRPVDVQRFATSGGSNGRRNRLTSTAAQPSWKKSNGLPESSPIKPTKHSRLPSNHASHHSFRSDEPNAPDEPQSPESSEDDDADLPVHNFNVSTVTHITSSPPRTPPPDRRLRKAHNVSWSRTPKNDGEGADLLLYLANSPVVGIAKTPVQPPPSTPPCKSTPLPSSHMTPGTSGAGFLGFAPYTPATNFNFADFVNITPSPAQGPWSRTPVVGRTPGGSREARRKLTFDGLAPPSTSPVLTRSGRGEGLGMELGGELVSS